MTQKGLIRHKTNQPTNLSGVIFCIEVRQSCSLYVYYYICVVIYEEFIVNGYDIK